MKNYFYFFLLCAQFFFGTTNAQLGDIGREGNISSLEVQKYQAEFDALWFDKEYFETIKINLSQTTKYRVLIFCFLQVSLFLLRLNHI